MIYAYNITDPSSMKITGNSDEGEWAASKTLSNLIVESGLTNTFLAITRRHAGSNLGQKRFTIITDVARKVLESLKST